MDHYYSISAFNNLDIDKGIDAMYISPVEVYTQKVIQDMQEQQENCVMTAILNTGIKVDKDELIKALNYDRQQYQKGYKDGRNELVKAFADEIERTVEQAKYSAQYHAYFVQENSDIFLYGLSLAVDILTRIYEGQKNA